MKDINNEYGYEAYCRVHDHFYIVDSAVTPCPLCAAKHKIDKKLLKETIDKFLKENRNGRKTSKAKA